MTRTMSRFVSAFAIILSLAIAIFGVSIAFAGQALAAPPKPSISSVASPTAGQAKVQVKAVKGAKGYEFAASTAKSFDSAARYAYEAYKTTSRSALIKGLKEGKTYYVKVRAYDKKGNCGKWSAVKTVKVKKSTALSDAKADAAKYKKQADAAAAENKALKAEVERLKAQLGGGETVQISYALNGGSLPSGAKTTVGSNEGSYTLPTPNRNGCDFSGWYDSYGNRISKISFADARINVNARWSNSGGSGTGGRRFVTGGEAGTYYALGTIIAQNAQNTVNLGITAVSSGGSAANIYELEDGTAEFAFCQSDIAVNAYQGKNLFQGSPVSCFSTVARLYDEQVQIVTCNSAIKTVADLAGKKVSIGAAGSSVYFNAINILGAYGLTEGDISPTYQSFADSAEALKDGKIDAAFIVAGVPTAAVSDLSISKQIYLVEIDAQHAATLVAASPYYSQTVVSAGTYPGQTADVSTVSVGALVIAANTVSDDDVYDFLSSVFENLDSLKMMNTKFNEFSLAKAASMKGVPYHPGAARYFAEKGYTVSSVNTSLTTTSANAT